MTQINTENLDSLAEILGRRFDIFIGIDQTGAATSRGLAAKPLPLAVFSKRNGDPQLFVCDHSGRALSLPRLHPSELLNRLHEIGALDSNDTLDGRIALLVDSVFGLPTTVWPKDEPPGAFTLWKLFQQAAQDHPERSGFGIEPAARFFESLLLSHKQNPYHSEKLQRTHNPPARQCERIAGANSVFRTRPYQRNIQCGTYRVWRDLGSADNAWLNIRNFESRDSATRDRPWLFEGYPSLLWRTLLDLKTRDLSQLPNALQKCLSGLQITENDRRLLTSNADLADAAVLAVSGALLQGRQLLFDMAPFHQRWRAKEGWIVGLRNET